MDRRLFLHGIKQRRNRENRYLLAAVSGLSFSLMVITALFLSSGTRLGEDITPTVTNVNRNLPVPAGRVTLYGPEFAVAEGTSLEDVKLIEIIWPISKEPPEAIRSKDEIRKLYAGRNILPMEPITRGMTSTAPEQNTLPVTRGNRAITVQVNDLMNFEGNIEPGSLVDVTLTYNEGGELVSRFVVQKARVISYGGKVRKREVHLPTSAARPLYYTVTLDVPAEEALKIRTAEKLGTLGFLMRHKDDNTILPDSVISDPTQPDRSVTAPKDTSHCGVVSTDDEDFVISCSDMKPMRRLRTKEM